MSRSRNAGDSRQIVQNAGWLYFRLGIKTFADLLLVRLVVGSLGVSGFGVYAAVAGVVSLVFFLQWSVELTVRRFISVALNERDERPVAEAFSAGCVLTVVLCILFALVSETAGQWFACTRLNVDAAFRDQLGAVFQLSVGALAINTLRMPFEALIIASERMDFFAKVSLLEAVLSLSAAVCVSLFASDRLVAYAAFLLVGSAVVMSVYAFYCRYRLSRRARFVRVPAPALRAQVVFFLKSLPSDLANVAKSDGVNLVLNAYCGSLYNATTRMSSSVGSGIYGIIGNFQQAYFPRVVRAWAGGDRAAAESLLAFAVRWSTVLVSVLVVPIVALTRPILSFWIGTELPPQAEAFVRCVAVHYLFSAMTSPMHAAILATGRIGVYQLFVAAFMALGFGLAWGALALGLPAWLSVGSVALANALSFGFRLLYLKLRLGLPVGRFLGRVLLPMCYNGRHDETPV